MDKTAFYVFGFWWFVFSSDFRRSWWQDFQAQSYLGKIWDGVEVLFATFLGLGAPLVFAVYVTGHVRHKVAVDQCLDAGGSFDYSSCQCDFESNHPFVKQNQCN